MCSKYNISYNRAIGLKTVASSGGDTAMELLPPLSKQSWPPGHFSYILMFFGSGIPSHLLLTTNGQRSKGYDIVFRSLFMSNFNQQSFKSTIIQIKRFK